MRPIKIADRHLMGHHAAKPLPRKPGVEMKGRRFDLERRFAQLREIEVDGVIGRGADRGGDTGENGQGRAMDMAGGDQLYARMAPYDRSKFSGVEQVLAVHMPNAGRERRMMQE